jgi:hypothetical protein
VAGGQQYGRAGTLGIHSVALTAQTAGNLSVL